MGFFKSMAGFVINEAIDTAASSGTSTSRSGDGSEFGARVVQRMMDAAESIYFFETDSAEFSKLVLGALAGAWGVESMQESIIEEIKTRGDYLNERGRDAILELCEALLQDCADRKVVKRHSDLMKRYSRAKCEAGESAVSEEIGFSEGAGMLWLMLFSALTVCDDGYELAYGLAPEEFASIIRRNYANLDVSFKELLIGRIPDGAEWNDVRIALGVQPVVDASGSYQAAAAPASSGRCIRNEDGSIVLVMTGLQFSRLSLNAMLCSLYETSGLQLAIANYLLGNMDCWTAPYKSELFQRVNLVIGSDFPEDERDVWRRFSEAAADEFYDPVADDALVQVLFSEADDFWVIVCYSMMCEWIAQGIGVEPHELLAIIAESTLAPSEESKQIFATAFANNEVDPKWNVMRTALGIY